MSKSFEISGILHVKSEEIQITEKFKKRTFVLSIPDHSGREPIISLSLMQDQCSLIDDIEIGDSVSVNFNINGREWFNKKTDETQYFNDMVAYRISKLDSKISNMDVSGEGDDLPF